MHSFRASASSYGSPSAFLLALICASMASAAFTGSGSTSTFPPVSDSTSSVSTFVTIGAPVTGGRGARCRSRYWQLRRIYSYSVSYFSNRQCLSCRYRRMSRRFMHGGIPRDLRGIVSCFVFAVVQPTTTTIPFTLPAFIASIRGAQLPPSAALQLSTEKPAITSDLYFIICFACSSALSGVKSR